MFVAKTHVKLMFDVMYEWKVIKCLYLITSYTEYVLYPSQSSNLNESFFHRIRLHHLKIVISTPFKYFSTSNFNNFKCQHLVSSVMSVTNYTVSLTKYPPKCPEVFSPEEVVDMIHWFIGLLVYLHDQTGYTTNNYLVSCRISSWRTPMGYCSSR